MVSHRVIYSSPGGLIWSTSSLTDSPWAAPPAPHFRPRGPVLPLAMSSVLVEKELFLFSTILPLSFFHSTEYFSQMSFCRTESPVRFKFHWASEALKQCKRGHRPPGLPFIAGHI